MLYQFIMIDIKTKIRTYGHKVYTNPGGLNESEDGLECESITAISIDSLLVYASSYYLQVYLDNFAYKIVTKKMIDIFMAIFLSLIRIKFLILINGSNKCYTTIELI